MNPGRITQGRNPVSGEASNKGVVLLLTLIVSVSLAIFGAALSTLVSAGMRRSALGLERSQALYLAEAGISKSIWELKRGIDEDEDGLGNIPRIPFGAGTYQATHNPSCLSIEGVGEVNGVKRTVRIVYKGL